MNLTEFSIKQKVLVNLISIAVVILGTVTTLQMKRETFQAISIGYVTVHTRYSGSSPYEVEKLVTMPIEKAIDDVEGIKAISSVSSEGSSFIFLELEPDLENNDKVINEIGREVDKALIPNDAEDPEVNEFILEEPLIEISFTADNVSEEQLRQYAKDFEDIIKNIKGIGTIDRLGWRDKEISIEVDPANLEKYYISLAQVIRSIENQNVNLPGGKLTAGRKELILRTVGEVKEAKGFEKIIIRTNNDGRSLYVGDVAKAIETFEEQSRIYKTNGKVSINLLPKKKKSGDTIKLVDAIKKEVEKQREILPDNVSIDLVRDMAFYVKRRLNVLVANGAMGLVLLVITLLLFLNVRIALVTALGIPFAFLTALTIMSFFDVSLNLLTMFGLILVLGMIVDDAIVVSENVYRYMEEGMSPREATIKGAREVIAPVTATILTTIAAFLPLMFISGIMGKFLKFFPMGVIFCLCASLFEATIILPSHLAEWAKPLKGKHDREGTGKYQSKVKQRSLIGSIFYFPIKIITTLFHYLSAHERKGSESRWFQAILSAYTRLLNFSVKKRYQMCSIILLILIGAIVFSIKIMPFKLFPDMIEIVYVKIETPEGTALKETNEVLSAVEKVCLSLPKEELENVTAVVGSSGGGDKDINNKLGTRYAQCVIYLTPEIYRQRKAEAIIAQLREEIEEMHIPNLVNLSFEKMQDGPPVGKPIAVEVRGENYDRLLEITEKIMVYLRTIDGVKDIKNDYELDKEEVQVVINKEEAARLGLNVRQIGGTIRYAFEGGVATTMRKDDEDIDVVVRFPEKDRNSLTTLKNLTIPNDSGRLIELSKVAHFSKSQGIKNITRIDRKRTITTTANIDEKKITSVEANKKIIAKFGDIPQRYPGYYFKSGGEWEDTTESVNSMFKAFITAFMLIYIILATQFRSFFQPLIIMAAIPFGLTGVIIALFLHGQPISMMALFGIVGLTGVVVNDALILVDFINKRIEAGKETISAVIEAGRTRLRPILLTSITTIIALLPLIYGIGGDEPFMVPAAIAMAYGLLAATFLTLIIVPCIFIISMDIQRFFMAKKRARNQII